jgi:prepilin-type N-terminal cleavage/methylation domain-containing protein
MIKRKAFTLVEFMIVLAILGLLVTLGVPGFLRSRNKAWYDTCVNNLRMIEHAADQYRIDNNLLVTQDVNILWLWPSTSTAKDVSAYVNKQLFCPQGSFYRGGTAAGAIPAGGSTLINANNHPHCADGSTSTTRTNSGLEFEHSVENADN